MATYQVGADGKAQSGLKAGDEVVTAGGTYKITGVNADGTYQSTLSNKNQTTNSYTGGYANGSTSSGGGSSSSGGITTATGKTYATGNATYSDYEGGTKRGVKDQTPDVGRHQELANQSVYRDGYVHHYDEDGYLKYAEKSESPSYAGHTDLTKDKYGYTTDKNMWTDEGILTPEDLARIEAIRAQGAAGTISWAEANAQANAIRQGYGYTITQDGTVVDQNAVDRATAAQQNTGATYYYDKDTGTYKPIVSAPATNVGTVTQSPGAGATPNGSTGGVATQTPNTATGTAKPQVNMNATPSVEEGSTTRLDHLSSGAAGQQIQTLTPGTTFAPVPTVDASQFQQVQQLQKGEAGQRLETLAPGSTGRFDTIESAGTQPIEKIDVKNSDLGKYLDQWLQSAQQQQTGAIDYATNQGIKELDRAEQDAAGDFQTQRNQIAVDEAKAKDNQALYAETRGDKGGIGAAQYDSIANTAAQNRLAVNSAQTKLATDTARQISDLRAQGEYEKADAMLSLSQQYLSQLMQLEQWAAEYNLTAEQFNAQLEQWVKEYNLQVQQLNNSQAQWEQEYNLNVNQYNSALDQWEKEFNANAVQQNNALQQWAAEHNLDAAQLEAALKQWELDYNADATSKNNALQQWLAEYNLGVDKFNANQEQWEKEFNLSVNDQNNALQQWAAEYALTQQKYADDKAASEQSSLASAGETLLSAGIMPSASQLSAMGITSAQAQEYITLAKAAAALKAKSSTGSGGGNEEYEPKLTQPQVVSAIENGMITSQVKQDYEYYFGERYVDDSEYDEYGNTKYTSLDYDQDEGIITWNGKKYTSVAQFLSDVEGANLSTAEWTALEKKLNANGFYFE